jgi:signal peptidase I
MMTTAQQTSGQSPWISVWLKPRRTIEGIVATRPQHRVLLLASLSAMSGLAAWLIGYGLTLQLLDWRVWLGLAVAGVIGGILGIYATALAFRWIGWLLGGRASMPQLRALVAWSGLPSILGLIVVLVILIASKLLDGEGATAPSRLAVLPPAIIVICGLWAFVVLLLMLSRVQGFGFWRTIAAYVLGQILLWSIFFIPLLAIRTLLFQPFNMPSHSMVPGPREERVRRHAIVHRE